MQEDGTGGLHVFAPAKVNLYLHVLGRRPDGLHLLDSLVVFAGIGDALHVRPAADISLTLEGPFGAAVPGGEDNLVYRAALLLRDRFARSPAPGAAITLRKMLPAAAGIGGGSADAAAVLRALVRVWQLQVPEAALLQIGAELGADVPVCLTRGPRFLGGVGERLAVVPSLPAAALVLANPGVALSTPAVFSARQGPFSAPARWDDPITTVQELAARLAARRNDLTQPARTLVPEIDPVLDALDENGALVARLSGSGPTCFGLFDNPAAASDAADRIAQAHRDWWVVAAPMLRAGECDGGS